MKTGIIKNSGKHGYFNLTAITDKGGAMSTQVWSQTGSPAQAAKTIIEWRDRGEACKGDPQAFDSQILYAFIHSTATGETYRYDLDKTSHLVALCDTAADIAQPQLSSVVS